MGQTGQSVASYGYVMVKAPTMRALPTAYRVELLFDDQVVALVRRREAILAKRISARRAWSKNACLTCALRQKCDSLLQ